MIDFFTMKIWNLIFFVAVPVPLLALPPVVFNVRGLQRPGTKLVDISYDLEDADSSVLTVSLRISADGGSTWAVPVTGCTGQIGDGISPGMGRMVTWDAGTNWDNHYSTVVRFRVSADDGTATAPAGFARIPAGPFQMGDQSNPPRGDADEGPVHTVTVSTFYMGTTEVSYDNWQATHGWALGNGYAFDGPGRGKAANHPVHSVTWYDAVKWCNAKSQQDGLQPCYTVDGVIYQTGQSEPSCDFTGSGYRLPTEVEWEKSARGGTTGTDFPWGDTINHIRANYFSSTTYSYDISSTRDYHPSYRSGRIPYTSPVGAFGPNLNGYGLVDMTGNVWEWCWDWYDASYYSSPPDTDPRGPIAGSERIGRGGIWADDAKSCRPANRDKYVPAGRDSVTLTFLGLRLARGSLAPGESISGAVSGDSPDVTVNTISVFTGQWAARLPDGGGLLDGGLWTGSEVVNPLSDNTVHRYDPVTNSVTTMVTADAPAMGDRHTRIWTGSEIIVWGGQDGSSGLMLNTGGRYNPATNAWTPVSTVGAPIGRSKHSAAWTGSEMIIWGGSDAIRNTDTGGRYDPTTDTWKPVGTGGAP